MLAVIGCGESAEGNEEQCPAPVNDGLPDTAEVEGSGASSALTPSEDDDEFALVCPEEVRAELTRFVYECRGGDALGCEESGRVHVELEIVAPDDREFLVDVFGWSTGNEALTGNDGIVASSFLELRAGQVEHVELDYVEAGPCQPTDFERAHVFFRLHGRPGLFAVDAQTQRSGCE